MFSMFEGVVDMNLPDWMWGHSFSLREKARMRGYIKSMSYIF